MKIFRKIFRKKPIADPDNDPIAITHEQDPSLEEDEMILYTTIDPSSINKENNE